METLYLPQALFAKDFKQVYEPAEDTFILLDALENDLNHLKKNAKICLECGSGSGVVITSIAKSLAATAATTTKAPAKTQPKNGSEQTSDSFRLLLATDINYRACQTTQKCATYFGQEHNVEVIQTDLAESLVDRLEHSVDLLVFNPPYVPTEGSAKTARGSSKNSKIQLAWAGGRNGREVIDVFLKSYVKRLLSKPNGLAYMVALEANNINELKNCLNSDDLNDNITGSVVLKRKAGSESLCVLKYQYSNAENK